MGLNWNDPKQNCSVASWHQSNIVAMIKTTSSVLFCFFSHLIAKKSIESFIDNPIDFQDNSEMELELNALRRTIPGEPGQ